MEQQFYNNSIFHIEVGKIKPNPYQPRREFNESKLGELADSIRQYGVLQPLVVTRREFEKEDGGLGVEYELIAGERRLRAAKIAGLAQIPAVIRAAEDDDRMKLELAIIENLQREDLNPVDRAAAFKKLADEFGFKHGEIAKRVGKSREYVSNTIRLLMLPEEMTRAISEGKISEGHARALLMLVDRPEEQEVLYKEIVLKKISVRETEGIARRIAYEKVRRHVLDPDMVEMEEKLTEVLGTRVRIDKKDVGGKVLIDFFNHEDLQKLLGLMQGGASVFHAEKDETPSPSLNEPEQSTPSPDSSAERTTPPEAKEQTTPEPKTDDGDLYSVKNFSV